MSEAEIKKHYREAVQQVLTLKPQEFRKTQYDNYKKFVQKVLGININRTPTLDPFYELSGYTAKEAYLDKHNFKMEKESELIITTTTDLLSAENLLSTLIPQNPDREPDIDRFWVEETETEKIFTRFGLIGEVITSTEKEWKFNFSSSSFSVFSDTTDTALHIFQGLVFIEPEVTYYLLKNPNHTQLYRTILQIVQLANHDMLGHGTMDLGTSESPEGYHQASLSSEMMHGYEIFYSQQHAPNHFQDYLVWFDERRRLSFHFKLAELFFKRRNVLKLQLKKQFLNFENILTKSFYKNEMTMNVLAYLTQLYLFFLLRILPYEEVLKLCVESRTEIFLDYLLRHNPEVNKLQKLLSQKTHGALYFDKKHHNDPQKWTMENALRIPHDVFYKNVFSRMGY